MGGVGDVLACERRVCNNLPGGVRLLAVKASDWVGLSRCGQLPCLSCFFVLSPETRNEEKQSHHGVILSLTHAHNAATHT